MGKRIVTKMPFSGVPKDTEGIVSQADGTEDRATVGIVWDISRSQPLMDWFNKEEYGNYLQEVPAKPWSGPEWDCGYTGSVRFSVRPLSSGGFEGYAKDSTTGEETVLLQSETMVKAKECIWILKTENREIDLIKPWTGEPGIICLPLVSNIPDGRPGWKETTCPSCGRDCWMAPQAWELIDAGRVVGACTLCALRLGGTNRGIN